MDASERTRPKRKLVLHFDINSTILMKDTAKGIASVQFTVARMLAKACWGNMIPCQEAEGPQIPQWVLAHDKPCWGEVPQFHSTSTLNREDIELMDYESYLKKVYPKDGEQAEENEKTRNELILKFTDEEQPGQKFKFLYDNLIKALTLPQIAKDSLNLPEDLVEKVRTGQPLWETRPAPEEEEEEENMSGDESKKKNEISEDEKMIRTCYGEGMYYIIPSFFRMLTFLKKMRRDFQVVFRSFGDDIQHVIWEFNKFCDGHHPCFSGEGGTPLIMFNGLNGTRDMRINDPSQTAVNYRLSSELKDVKMITGLPRRLTPNFEDASDCLKRCDTEYENSKLIANVGDQFKHIQETLQVKGTMAMQEDYFHWKENDFHRECAKLLLIDQSDSRSQHIFFDDNAEEGEKCIVDVRDLVTNEVLPYKKQIGRYVVKSDPIKAILEPDYFIRMIEQCEANRDHQLRNQEKGIEEDLEELKDEEKVAMTEWQQIQKMPNDEYLMRTILPVLYQGMQIVEQNRPVNPIEFLAVHLLQNQHLIKLPPRE